jgi:hypothetical protein
MFTKKRAPWPVLWYRNKGVIFGVFVVPGAESAPLLGVV